LEDVAIDLGAATLKANGSVTIAPWTTSKAAPASTPSAWTR